jgi:HPt (histidine-containing phosphotransfer) domain-containing protein
MQSTDFLDYPIDQNTVTHPTDPAPIERPLFGDRPEAIDWQQLRQLSEGNEEFERELLHIFVTETRSLLQQAQQAILRNDAPPLSHIAHQIKGGSGNIGMHEIVRVARELEQSAQTEDWESAANQLAQIRRSLNDVQNLLHAP